MSQRLTNHEDRFAARVTIGTPEQCWLWEGAVGPTGYGQFWPYGRAGGKIYAHRYAYERGVGPIPDGLTIDHICHNNDTSCPGGSTCPHRRCINPAHLEPATMQVQVRRGRHWTQNPDGSWVCSRGHAIDEGVVSRRGTCPTCFNEYRRQWRESHSEAPSPAARARRNQKRRNERSVITAASEAVYAAQRRTRLFVAVHPELTGEVDRIGQAACAQRLRRGWTFANGEWHRPE